MPRIVPVLSSILLVLCACGCKHAVSNNVAATVNGRVITFADLDKQYQAQFMSSSEKPSSDQMEIQKLEVLRTLVDNEIMLQRAEKLDPTEPDAHFRLGRVYQAMGKKDASQGEFAKVRELHEKADDVASKMSVPAPPVPP